MAVSPTQKTVKQKKHRLINQLESDYQVNLVVADDFHYSHQQNSIFYDPKVDNWQLLLIHELAHFLLKHQNYQFDRQLLKMETDAWELVKDELATKYQIKIDYDLIENTLDSYRDWLYSRSRCPKCNSIGNQFDKNKYKCLNCDSIWKVNQAKFVGLKRCQIKNDLS